MFGITPFGGIIFPGLPAWFYTRQLCGAPVALVKPLEKVSHVHDFFAIDGDPGPPLLVVHLTVKG